MKTRCPHCNQDYNVEAADLGTQGNCEKCNRDFTIRRKLVAAPDPVAPVQPVSQPAKKPWFSFGDGGNRNQSEPRSTLRIALTVLFSIIVVGKAIRLYQRMSSTSPVSAQSQTSAAKPQTPSRDFELLNHEVVQMPDGDYQIKGTVKNTTAVAVRNVVITISLYKLDAQNVERRFPPLITQINNIAAGGSSNFAVHVPYRDVSRYEISNIAPAP